MWCISYISNESMYHFIKNTYPIVIYFLYYTITLDTSRQTCVVASGGLCTFAAAHVLKSHEGSYNQVKKVVFSISTNGALHGSDQHCADDREPHIKLLEQEAKRLFPNAKLHFLMPFGGSKGVSNSYITELRAAVANASQMTIHNPPNMDSMLKADGVHVTWKGETRFR